MKMPNTIALAAILAAFIISIVYAYFQESNQLAIIILVIAGLIIAIAFVSMDFEWSKLSSSTYLKSLVIVIISVITITIVYNIISPLGFQYVELLFLESVLGMGAIRGVILKMQGKWM